MEKDKNIYFLVREELKYSRDAACDKLLDRIFPDRLYRIEHDVSIPTPEEVCDMAKGYKRPDLRNYYCKNQCEIGITSGLPDVQSINKTNLPQMVLELLSSLNAIEKETLIDISADGEIDKMEMSDFIDIRDQLNRISNIVESLKLWAELHIEE